MAEPISLNAFKAAPADFFYGMHELSVRDSDGNRISFGQPTNL
jgi:hypothetical protein